MVESAVRHCSRSRIDRLLEGGRARERYHLYMDKSREILLLVIVIHYAAFAWLTVRIAGALQAEGGTHWQIVLWVFGVVICGAELPGRLLGTRWSVLVLLPLLPVLYVLGWVFRPLTFLLGHFSAAETHDNEDRVIDAAKEEIRVAIEDGATEGAIAETEKEMIEGILEFRDAAVSEIMTRRVDMECIDGDLTLAEARSQFEKFSHSRIPVYEENRDRVLGVIYLRDVLAWVGKPELEKKHLKELARRPFFVPEMKRIGELLRDFQSRRVHLAIVLDEYGGVAGLITIEDILEEIVGEIRDEYDQKEVEHEIAELEDGSLQLDARIRVDDMNEEYGTDIPDYEDYDTIGGYVSAKLGRIPARGEEFDIEGMGFQIVDADERRIKVLRVQWPQPSRPREEGEERARQGNGPS